MNEDLNGLAQRRRDSRDLLKHLRFVEENYVEPAMVKTALLGGLSQSETAKLLGMSKRTVNQHARRPFAQYGAARDERSGERRDLERAFLAYVWGSDEAAGLAAARSIQYDRERLHVEPA